MKNVAIGLSSKTNIDKENIPEVSLINAEGVVKEQHSINVPGYYQCNYHF